jgi:hypothetical protein
VAGQYQAYVTGLKELRKELKRAGDEFPQQLRDTNFAVADRIVVPVARRKAYAVRALIPVGKRRRNDRTHTSHWADFPNSIRALASQTRATVALGSNRKKDAWIVSENFGSATKKQFPRLEHPDHALYAAIEETHDKIISTYSGMLGELTRKAFPD